MPRPVAPPPMISTSKRSSSERSSELRSGAILCRLTGPGDAVAELCEAGAVSGRQEGVDQHLIRASAQGATDQRAHDGYPPVVLRRRKGRAAPSINKAEEPRPQVACRV